jgi:hypothetical protein
LAWQLDGEGAAMNWLRVLVATTVLASAIAAQAHIGSPNVFFDGAAGAYPVRVIIRPPGVIPGLAEISVRVNTNGLHRVHVLPIRWDSGKEGAPRPDEASRVVGETNLYNAQLWFMRAGAQSVEIEVAGDAGHGRVLVPVNAIATRVLEMPRALGGVLAVLGIVLVVLAASIFGGAVREGVLPAGTLPTRQRMWIGRGMTALSLVVIVAFLYFGRKWWEREANDYRNNRLFKPVETDAEIAEGKLRVNFGSDLLRRNGPLVPDHGKLMHLFLVREPGMGVFAHLHPAKVKWNAFETALPQLPAGDYRLYGDVTYESGFADTLTTRVTIPASSHNSSQILETDDAWNIERDDVNGHEASFTNGFKIMRLGDGELIENREADLQFMVRDANGKPVAVEPYMGMAAHLILRRDDGSVFTHLHPSGTFSMAAKQLFDLRAEGKALLKVADYTKDPLCRLPLNPQANAASASEFSFPYAFPRAGKYRLWVQTKIRGEVMTGVFDVNVQPARRG